MGAVPTGGLGRPEDSPLHREAWEPRGGYTWGRWEGPLWKERSWLRGSNVGLLGTSTEVWQGSEGPGPYIPGVVKGRDRPSRVKKQYCCIGVPDEGGGPSRVRREDTGGWEGGAVHREQSQQAESWVEVDSTQASTEDPAEQTQDK